MEAATQSQLDRAKRFGIQAELVELPARIHVAKFSALERRAGQVVVDATTLLAAARAFPVLEEFGAARLTDYCSEAELAGALSLIQALVVHDRIWVDALTLARSDKASRLAQTWSPLISAFVADDKTLYDLAWHKTMSLQTALKTRNIPDIDVNLWQAERLDRPYLHPGNEFAPTDGRSGATILLRYDDGRGFTNIWLKDIPVGLADSNSGIARTLFYLNVSARIGYPYVPHPNRAALIDSFLHQPGEQDSVPHRVIKELDRELLQGDETYVRFPPVAEVVLRQHRDGATLLETIASFRQRAALFRKWCAELEVAIRSGRPGVSTRKRLEQELAEAKTQWKTDPDNGVRYKATTLSFQIPFVDKFVKLKGASGELRIKDPVLWSRNKPLLFLNSLYQPTRAS